MKIWQKHLFLTLAKTFVFFFLLTVFLYIAIDISIHGMKFFAKCSIGEIGGYYMHMISGSFELFATFAFFLAALFCLFQLMEHRELIALQMAALSKQRLCVPFFLFAAIVSMACYLNAEWFVTESQVSALALKASLKESKRKKARLYQVSLAEDRELVYRDSQGATLYDVFLIEKPNAIWHMKEMNLTASMAKEVHLLQRNAQNVLEKKATYPEKEFSFDSGLILQSQIPLENRPLSALILQNTPRARAHLYYKLLSPLMPLLTLFPLAPCILRYNRTKPVFLISAFSLFAFLAYKVLFDGFLILAENQALSPVTALFFLPVMLLTLSLPAFAKMR